MTIYWGTTSPFDHTLCSEQFSVLIVHPACSNLQYDGVFVFVVPQPVAQPRERSSSRVGRRRNKSPCRIYMHYHSNRTGNISLEPALIKLATPALHGANRGTWDRRHEWEHRPVYMTPNARNGRPPRPWARPRPRLVPAPSASHYDPAQSARHPLVVASVCTAT